LYIQQVESRSQSKDALHCNFLQYIDSQDVRREIGTASCLVRYLLDSIVTLYGGLARQNQSVVHESLLRSKRISQFFESSNAKRFGRSSRPWSVHNRSARKDVRLHGGGLPVVRPPKISIRIRALVVSLWSYWL